MCTFGGTSGVESVRLLIENPLWCANESKITCASGWFAADVGSTGATKYFKLCRCRLDGGSTGAIKSFKNICFFDSW